MFDEHRSFTVSQACSQCDCTKIKSNEKAETIPSDMLQLQE